MRKRKAVYAASFDPITFGHLDVIEGTAPLYDELVVLVAINPQKSYTFTLEEKRDTVKSAVAHIPNVSVDVCVGEYVVKRAKQIGAKVIIRGLRNSTDLQDEQALAETNRMICPDVKTILVLCLPSLMHVSSSVVKGLVGADPGWEHDAAQFAPQLVVTKLKEKHILGKARKHWDNLMSALGNPKGSDQIFKDLIKRYSEPHRAYHNLAHVVSMLDVLDEIQKMDLAVILAVWFHDAVYDPMKKNNEGMSAMLARMSMRKMGLPDSFGEQVYDFVMVTKHTSIPKSYTAQILADLDLMILGKSEREFDQYEVEIREEYKFATDNEFFFNRSIILQSFLNRPSIYLTDLFKDKYEDAAKKNLKRSIERMGD